MKDEINGKTKKQKRQLRLKSDYAKWKKTSQKSTTSWTTASSGKKSPDSVLLNVRLAVSSSRISLGTTTDIRRGKRVRVAEANYHDARFKRKKPKRVALHTQSPTSRLNGKKEAYEEFKKHRFQVLACGVRCGLMFWPSFPSNCWNTLRAVLLQRRHEIRSSVNV